MFADGFTLNFCLQPSGQKEYLLPSNRLLSAAAGSSTGMPQTGSSATALPRLRHRVTCAKPGEERRCIRLVAGARIPELRACIPLFTRREMHVHVYQDGYIASVTSVGH